MGPIGWPETVFIFFLALLLFGPKKLPDLGRTVGKALSEFQRTKGEMMAAFERETKQLALDTEDLTAAVNRYQAETCAFDASAAIASYQSSYGLEANVPSQLPAASEIGSAHCSAAAPNQAVPVG